MPLLIYYDDLYMLRPLISALILESLHRKGLICALFILHFIALAAVIHLVRLSEGKSYLGFSTSEVQRLQISF